MRRAFSSISTGKNYTVSNTLTITTTGSVINSSGKTLNNFEGIYLFDLWSNNLLSKSASTAGAVQVAIWESEGYSSTDIMGNGGFSFTDYTNANNLIPTLLGTTDISGSWSSSWTPTDVGVIYLTHNGSGAQDQIVLVNTSNNNNSVVPEPVSILVWGAGAGLAAGAVAMRRREEPRRKWSAKNRQAILQIVQSRR